MFSLKKISQSVKHPFNFKQNKYWPMGDNLSLVNSSEIPSTNLSARSEMLPFDLNISKEHRYYLRMPDTIRQWAVYTRLDPKRVSLWEKVQVCISEQSMFQITLYTFRNLHTLT